APALGPPAEGGHRKLAPDEQDADPERDAAPDRNVVEVVALAGNPVDRDQRGKEEELVGNRVEELAQVADHVAAAGQVAVEYVAHGGDHEDHEADELRP